MDYTAARETMVDCQIRPCDVTKYPIIDAFLTVPREAYVPSDKAAIAYMGENLALAGDRVMLDARSLAKMLDALALTKKDLVLDIACGSGYSSAIIAKMAQVVVALEESTELANQAAEIFAQQEIYNAIVVNSLLCNGAPKHGPYDAMIVQGGIEEFPDTLAQQLKEGGRVAAIFQQGPLGICKMGFKSSDSITWRNLFEATAPLLADFTLIHRFQFL